MKRVALVLMCISLVPVVTAADLVIKEKTSSGGFMGMGASEGTEVTYVKGDKVRTESTVMFKGMRPGMAPAEASTTVTIIRLDKGVVWHLDQDKKTYMEISLSGDEVGGTGGEARFEVKDIKVEKTGEKRETAGYKCEGVNVEMTYEASSGAQMMTETTDILFWITPEGKELKEMRTVWERMLERAGSGKEDMPMKHAMRELSKTMEDLEGVPLGMDIVVNLPMAQTGEQEAEMKEAMKMMRQFMKGEEAQEEAEEGEDVPANQMKITRETVSISVEDVDDSLFEIPEGYKQTKGMYSE
jgi:hypothetical protein